MRRLRSMALLLMLGCARTVPAVAQGELAGGELPPPGYGALNQDQLSIRLASSDIEVRFVPLDERVLRLLAPDAYASLHGLVVSRQAAIDSAASASGLSTPGLALVSFFGRRSDARFDPENLSLSYHNQLWRPAAIVPYSSNFGGRQLDVRQQAIGIYLFESPLPVYEAFDVVYGSMTSNAWQDVLLRIERERNRVVSRWQSEKADSTKRP